ncbi:MAG TPA: hypothetical protein VMU53_02005 [Candidatus Sulfotelmatobacter sp.]|nr:hypothetical protein [Candidatus Sulfotelmatobacter sp.]
MEIKKPKEPKLEVPDVDAPKLPNPKSPYVKTDGKPRIEPETHSLMNEYSIPRNARK